MDCARNIITANFSGGGTSATTAPLWQWDYGQALYITGIEDLPAAFEVHFSTNRMGGVSTVAVGADGQVTIPNVLLTIGKNLNAWIYLSDSEGEGETEYSILIPVKARPMPETYDAEVTGEFDDVVRQVSEYAETAQTAADNAGASASAAAASADSAAASASAAESAKTAAETAQGKAEDAQTVAESAAQTATEKAQQTAQDAAQAAQSKADAESAAQRAEAAETGAEGAKTDAVTAAHGAADSASAASASATSAGQAATSAGQSATAAAGSATTAQNAAQTATTKAGEASASASAAAASETAAQTAQTGAETAATNAGQSASTATTKAVEAAQSASSAAQSKTDAEAAATRAETAAATLTVDAELSDTSANPVQNKVITGEVAQLKSAFSEIASEQTTLFNLSDWRNGYLRDSAPIGSVGRATQNLVSGYNGAYATTKGDDHTYSIALDSGWILRRLGKYANNTLGSFIEYVDTSSGEVTLSKSYFYIFEICKEPRETISASDVTATTIVLSETKYYPLLSEEIHSYNWCNPVDITANSGKYLDVNGVEGVGLQYSYTGFIPVTAGDKVYILRDGMTRTNARFRYVTAYDSSKGVLSSLGESTAGRIFTVPTGVAFIRVTVFLDDYNLGNYAININNIMPYDAYGEQTLPTGVGANKNDILLLNDMPLSTMPEYITKALAYRPLSAPKKGYICLVTDDGKEGMVSYTIPMVINKNVPCTFAVMSESECFATSERTQAVVDAVNNHGCAISQHGGRNWTEYSEYGLNKFFEEETTFFASIGLTAKSAVIPSHYTTPLVQAVAGGRYGVVRSGYKGYNAEGVYGGTVHNYYNYYTSGEGSNLFGLSSYNFSGRSLADNQMAIDYSYDNNKIMIVYWHENALTDATKAVMEHSIDYAKTKGLEFITLDKIPYLNEWNATF